ncbi:hypothetical protein [Burkholderia ubonensis]|uniref:hypothetical protein n=1 Tax=Burkholderia ubonensis TaxID=101571 RepID=UPI0012FA632A|nr:hypothetical protein [Burkholderia ubonensis]
MAVVEPDFEIAHSRNLTTQSLEARFDMVRNGQTFSRRVAANPKASSLDAMYAILDDKDRPYYEHKLAA